MKQDKLYAEALKLGAKERVMLAGLLLESLETSEEADVDADWQSEVERRMGEMDAGLVAMVPWEEVRQRLLDYGAA